ncbi:MAG: hypothetical protein JSV33_00995 [bacterium]|nr:MAG: hypothetical protein JSV33_00995 [bacterium]
MKLRGVIPKAVLLILVLCFAAAALGEQNSKRRPERELTRYEKVKKAMSVFVYGVQHEMPGIIISTYQPEDLVSKGNGPNRYAAVTNELRSFFNTFTATGTKPILYVSKSRIRWEGDEAVVECSLVWNVRDMINEKDVSYMTDELFRLRLKNGEKGDKYVIKDAVTTPIVFRMLANQEQFHSEIERVHATGGLR